MNREAFACLKLDIANSHLFFAVPTDWSGFLQAPSGAQVETRRPRLVDAEGIVEILEKLCGPLLSVNSLEEFAVWSNASPGTWGIFDREWGEDFLRDWFGAKAELYCRAWESGPVGFIEEALIAVAPKYARLSLDFLESDRRDFDDRIHGQLIRSSLALVARKLPAFS